MKHFHNGADVVCIARAATLHDAACLLRDRGIGSLVVTDAAGGVVGIVTDRDLCLRAVAFERDPHTTRVDAVMTADRSGRPLRCWTSSRSTSRRASSCTGTSCWSPSSACVAP